MSAYLSPNDDAAPLVEAMRRSRNVDPAELEVEPGVSVAEISNDKAALHQALGTLETSVADIKAQIGLRGWTDPAWRMRAETALRYKKRALQAVRTRLGVLRHTQRVTQAQSEPPAQFVGASWKKRALRQRAIIDQFEASMPREQFDAVLDEAQARNPELWP